MKYHWFLANILLVPCTIDATSDWLAGYDPLTYVADHAAIDLDQREIEKWLDIGIFQQAERLYMKGGHSQSRAKLRLLNPEPPSRPFPSGTIVYGTSVSGEAIQGRLVDTAMWSQDDDKVYIVVEYDREKSPRYSSYCQVGALSVTHSAQSDGCFMELGEVDLLQVSRDMPKYTYNYLYDVDKDNVNGRSIAQFSTSALDEMMNCTNCPHETFKKYVNYYGMPDYGNHMILAAIDGATTRFENGNVPFGILQRPTRAEAVKIGAKFLNIWMYSIRMMEHAIDQCELPCQEIGDIMYNESYRPICDDSPVRAWDQAVAFYTGSLEGTTGLGEGLLLFGLADTMCAKFLTCGKDASLRFGISYVNNLAIDLFTQGQEHVVQRECEPARLAKDKIVKIMTVPLVQATLLTAFEQVYGPKKDMVERHKLAMRGTSYASTVLPLVHDCNPEDALIIYENMLLDDDTANQTKVPDFLEVKQAFERNYMCMGITCAEVGGIWQGGDYFPYASPCQESLDIDSSRPLSRSIGIAIGAILGALTLGGLAVWSKRRLRDVAKARVPANLHVQYPVIRGECRQLD